MAKLTKCKGCGEEISKKAKSCPKCGEPTPKKTSLLTWSILGLIVAFALIPVGEDKNKDVDPEVHLSKEAKEALTIKIKKEQLERDANNPRKHITMDYSFSKGGFGHVMMVDFTIKNSNKKDIKDIAIRCSNVSRLTPKKHYKPLNIGIPQLF